jgi:hypothetical protein
MATAIEAFDVPARHRHGACTGLFIWNDRQMQAVDLTLTALRGGLQ